MSALRFLSCALAALTLSACSAGPLQDHRMLLAGTGIAGADLHPTVRSLGELRFATVVRQAYDFSCGSAALATLLTYHYGDPQGETSVFLGMWADGDREQIRRLGFSLLDMKRYLAARGVAADGYKVSLDDIQKGGLPGVALITFQNYRHFVTIKGVNEREVLVGDPSLGLKAIPRKEFEKMWNGIIFVLNDRRAIGRSNFNTPAQWVHFPRGRFYGAEPLSQQALALTAPFRLTDF